MREKLSKRELDRDEKLNLLISTIKKVVSEPGIHCGWCAVLASHRRHRADRAFYIRHLVSRGLFVLKICASRPIQH